MIRSCCFGSMAPVTISIILMRTFARELMELFTLSPKNDTGTPNYSETTVQEVAKACTGWRIVITGNEPNTVLETFYDSNFHAPGKKTLFGDKPFSGTADKDIDTIDYIFSSHPHAAVYLARRLAEEYLAPTPPKEIVDALAQVLRDTNFNFKIALKMLFSSDAFFEPQYRNTIIKTPLERIVEVLRRVQMPYDFTSLQVNVEGAGQQISNPPSVFGWNQQDWLTGQWLLNLSNTYTRVVNNDILFNAQSPVWTYAKLLPSPNATVNQVIDTLCDRMNITLNPQQRALLVNYFNTRLPLSVL
jgi:uncharacterized protein (DUF1800 family)